MDYTARAQEDARALAGSIEGIAHEVEERLTTQALQRPYWTLAAAAAAGFLVGGGLPRRWGRFAAGLAVRAAAGMAVTALTAQAAQQAAEPREVYEDEGLEAT